MNKLENFTKKLFFALTFLYPLGIFADNSNLSQDWLIENNGETTQNFHLNDKEKLKLLDTTWSQVKINNNRAQIKFPWSPDKYDIPNIYNSGVACAHRVYESSTEVSMSFTVMSYYCPGILTHTNAIKRRILSGKNRAIKNNRKLLAEQALNLKRGIGIEFSLKDKENIFMKSRIIGHKETIYILVYASKNKDDIDSSHSTRFLNSFEILE